MTDKNKELLARLLITFRGEASDHVRAMSNGLLALEKLPVKAPQYWETVETIFRQAHSLKGAARAVKFTTIESLCQPCESIFASLRDKKIALSTSLVDLLHQAVRLMEELAGCEPEEAYERQPQVSALARQLDRTLARSIGRGGQAPATPSPLEPVNPPALDSPLPPAPQQDIAEALVKARPAAAVSTVRIATAKLDAVMRLSEEMLASRLALEQRITEMKQATSELVLWRKQALEIHRLLRPLQQGLEKNDNPELRRLLDYVADEQVRIRVLQDQLTNTLRSTDSDRRTLAVMTESLQQKVKEMQLLPCAPLLEMFALQARELAREQGKTVAVTTQGGNIEVDRRLLEEIKDPLIHLARNCIDHGIEKPGQRRSHNKSPQGNINVTIAQQDNGKITLTIADDGKGIDTNQLKAVALARGLITAEEAEQLSETATLELVFHSGLSTSALITDVSGRGLGMAIVKDKIEQLGGTITLNSTKGHGAKFEIMLPINLATFRGMLVTIAQQTFIIPSAHVDCALRVPASGIHHINQGDTIGINGQALALVWMHDVLELPRTLASDTETVLVVILGRGAHRIAFRVDAVLGEQEVLVKGLGPQLRRVRNVAGASVLGNGEVVAVLNATDLLSAAVRQPHAIASAPTPAPARQRTILVAEDSITSRSLMKNILETAGYEVVTAVDGIDAYTTLKTQTVDLVVSDVDMPRMNGFELTAKLRADNRLADLPVVLVTTLDSREDRERGIDAGANAYIVKSSFDQNNLLEVIQRLI